ncbi:MAG: hypothetical protein DHS80DRAFT_25196 [Piptocephalis tieghemiana]|nr:MAG: hypothetical protein DHS80DRAFT_25196 [Piptocephalis tieghemiana]
MPSPFRRFPPSQGSLYEELDNQDRPAPLARPLEPSQAIALYWVTALFTLHITRYLLASTDTRFPYPLTVLLLQLILGAGAIKGYRAIRSAKSPLRARPIRWEGQVARQAVPLLLLYPISLLLNTWCQSFLSVSALPIFRALSLPISLLLLRSSFGIGASWKEWFGVGSILMAFWVLCYGQAGSSSSSLSTPGTLLGLFLALTLSLQQAYVPVALHATDGDILSLVYHICIASLVLLSPGYLFISHELGEIMEHVYFLGSPTFWVHIALSSGCSLLLLLASFHQIASAGPMTHAFSCASRLALQPLVTTLILGSSAVTFFSGFSILLLVLGGNYVYGMSR